MARVAAPHYRVDISRLTLLLMPLLIVLTNCTSQPKLETIILSYSEQNSFCIGCPSFHVDFHSGGHVNYECVSGCVVPGAQHFLVSAERFKNLVQDFHSAHFVDIPRTDPSRVVMDVPTIRLTYRDERKIHEVVDDDRRIAAITGLENRFKVAAEIDRYRKPSVPLYRSLVHSGWNVNTLAADHQNALSAAILNRDLESARFLLQSGSNVTDEALTYAAMSDNLEILRLVLTASSIKPTGQHGAAALLEAARSPGSDLLRYLLDSGISSNSQVANSGLTPLMSAVMNERLENAMLLLAKGADPNAADSSGHRALWYAAAAANTGFITLLLHYGADVNSTGKQGQTALMNAASRGYTWNIEALLKGGADPAIKDKQGKTALEATLLTADPKAAAARKILEQAWLSHPVFHSPNR